MTFEEAIAAGTVTQEQAFAVYDSLPPVETEEMTGTWKGSEFPSGHPHDGQLAATGWFGKRFADSENVDPLLFYTADGKSVFAVDPAKSAAAREKGVTGKAADLRSQIETVKPAARLRSMVYRGASTATMIYDQQPIFDHFRRVDADTLLGAMDARGDEATYFFVLRRAG